MNIETINVMSPIDEPDRAIFKESLIGPRPKKESKPQNKEQYAPYALTCFE